MDINIRKAILQNIATNSQEELEATIVDAIQTGEEQVLPGLGVLFELIWKQANHDEKLDMIHALEKGIKQESAT